MSDTTRHMVLLETNIPIYFEDEEYPYIVVKNKVLCEGKMHSSTTLIESHHIDTLDEEELSWCYSKLVSIYDLHCSWVSYYE